MNGNYGDVPNPAASSGNNGAPRPVYGPPPPPDHPNPNPNPQPQGSSSDPGRRQQRDRSHSSRRQGQTDNNNNMFATGSDGQQPPETVVRLWKDVADGLHNHQTVVWTKAVDSLESARQYLVSTPPSKKSSAEHDKTNSRNTDESLQQASGEVADPWEGLIFPEANPTFATLDIDLSVYIGNPAREFIDKYMIQIISILLEQQPMKIGQMEKDCVEKSLRCSLQIVKDDLEARGKLDKAALRERTSSSRKTAKDNPSDEDSSIGSGKGVVLSKISTLEALGHIFNKKKVYYKSTRQWSNSTMGMPEVRSHMISVFRRVRGFQALVQYLDRRAGTANFPAMELCKDLIVAAWESIPSGSSSSNSNNNGNNGQNGGNHNSQDSNEGDTINAAVHSQSSKYQAIHNEARGVAESIMKHILLLDEITLKKMDADAIKQIRVKLYVLYNRLSGADGGSGRGSSRGGTDPEDPGLLREFFTFWRSLALKLITSQSLPLKLFGWDTIVDIITESERLAPPPRAYLVKGAGTGFINGLYSFDDKRVMANGYVRPNVELQYHRKIPMDGGNSGSATAGGGGKGPNVANDAPPEGAGKTLTLFRCTMRSQHKWWFLSEADIDQPGTDKDIDYYQHKSKRDEEGLPSPSGWLTCRAGADSPPTLEAVGKLVPKGEEKETLEHLLARWAIENEVVELVLGDSIHREIVSRSTELIKFLASMCDRDEDEEDVEAMTVSSDPADGVTDRGSSQNKYCLQASHLLLAWKTCTNKADAAVSAQIYQLLVSILPSLSPALAIPLIEAIRDSLNADNAGAASSPSALGQQRSPGGSVGSGLDRVASLGITASKSNLSSSGGEGTGSRGDHFFEVSEFCCAIAEKMLAENSNANNGNNDSGGNNQDAGAEMTSEESKGESAVREAILSLQWAVLSHKDAQGLKSYESIKRYVSTEIRKQDSTTGVLRMKFLVHCRTEIAKNVSSRNPNDVDERHALHMVLLSKFLLEGYGREDMERLMKLNPQEPEYHFPTLFFKDLISYMRRRTKALTSPPMRKPSSTSSSPEFNHAKSLAYRLQTLRFAFGHPSSGKLSTSQLDHLWNVCILPGDREALMTFLANASRSDLGTPRLRPENSMHNVLKLDAAFADNADVFERLFCSENVGWENLGESAYRSFREFDAQGARDLDGTTDALWRICLKAGDGGVAGRAMSDLLAVYNSSVTETPSPSRDVSGMDENKDGTDDGGRGNQFSQRIFDCLVQVKEGLERGDRSSERSAERCIRILSAAIEQSRGLGGSAGAVAERLDSLQQQQQAASGRGEPLSSAVVEEYLNLVPHGMRGVCSCNAVTVIARATGRRGSPDAGSDRDEKTDGGGTRPPPDRFPLDIHPLQTLVSIKHQVANHCNHDEKCLKLNGLTGRSGGSSNDTVSPSSSGRANLSTMPDTTLAADLGVTEGSEIIALLSDKPQLGILPNSSPASGNSANAEPSSPTSSLDLTGLFSRNGPEGSSDLFFDTLISVLESLPEAAEMADGAISDKDVDCKKGGNVADTHSLVWDLLLAMPTNAGIIANVHAAATTTRPGNDAKGTPPTGDDMLIEPIVSADWSSLLDFGHFERSVYVMQILDSFLRPATAMFTSLQPPAVSEELSKSMREMATVFRASFIQSGGFEAVLRLFIESGRSDKTLWRRNRMGNECALRIITKCFFASGDLSREGQDTIESFAQTRDFLRSLVAIAIAGEDCASAVSDNAILRILRLVRMMLESGPPTITASFTSLPGNAAETFLTSLLLWKGAGSFATTSIRSATNIRKSTEEMILAIPHLFASALPWLVKSLKNIDPFTDGSDEFFSVLLKLVLTVDLTENAAQLCELGSGVCMKLASYPRPNSDTVHIDHSTGVLCGCLKLLQSLIEVDDNGGGGRFLVEGSRHILRSLDIAPWSRKLRNDSEWDPDYKDLAVINLMGSIFDGFISSAESSGLPPICCDGKSRCYAFLVISAAAHVGGGEGYSILADRINDIISNVAPSLRHRWGQNASIDDGTISRTANNSIKYSGLKNQGCTCYMNSVLQQLFMMPGLRKNLCSAEIPTGLRSSGGGAMAKGEALVGKKISLHWENGNKYDAIVDRYEDATGMHTIDYCPVQLATGVGHHHQQQQPSQPPDISSLPRDLPEEFILSEGRPGKETGAFEIISGNNRALVDDESSQESQSESKAQEVAVSEVKESSDESSSRKLLEEVQRTFVNLDEARGRCFDPRSLVEASHCLKLEFDVWQQNDASEFAMKLLDRLEISLKKWSPSHFRYLAHTFGMKQTKQKVCKECGLKTNREENMMNIDCQIRDKSSIHEALAGMCEDEIMEGDNKVFCDRCKVKTNTVLRTAISELPNMLVLSLKRFDLDYTTFETVKLNSRCEFGESLNMKQYTLEAKEILETAASAEETKSESGSMMDLEESETKDGPDEDPLSLLPDEDYEYRLAGVLVHAGVAQGGHYYSFIQDRTSEKWYRFDDEDVTAFDPSSIEQECFGGKVKKETKFPNGHTHTVESEQFANALMLFYEKVKPVKVDSAEKEKEELATADAPMEEEPKAVAPNLELSNGYDVFLPEVRKSNSTHSWQSFLLSEEFQKFVKEILDLCTGRKKSKKDDSMDITPESSPSPMIEVTEIDTWRLDVIQMSLSFVFDVLFHLSLKKEALSDWSKTLMQVFSSPSEITVMFVLDLAKRTHQVYENWVRAYTMECPEEGSRRAALQIFTSAISTSLQSRPTDQVLLQKWTQSWSTQVADKERLMNKRQHVGAMPTKLEAPASRQLEDVSNIGVSATSIGIILSFLLKLIEVSPRYTQANIDLCFFIRELATVKAPVEGKLLRDAMVEAQYVARLTCLAIRERSPDLLKHVFPGSSVSLEIVEAISRSETHSANILQVGMNSSGVSGGSNHNSCLMLLEAIGCLLGMSWVKQEPIFYETGEVSRGRSIRALTPRAIEALTAVFEESKTTSSNGMALRDIHHYLQRCGQHVPPQRVEQIFARHAVDEPDGTKLLNLKGFLAYYRDAVHNNDLQVVQELHAFGFRPNLTRRPDDARWYATDEGNGQKRPYLLRESMAVDVAMNHASLSQIHFFTELGLQALFFLNFATSNSRCVAEYLLAVSAYGKDTRRLMFESLGYLHNHIGNWVGGSSDGHPLIIMIFSVLTAIPDDRQQDRINTLMINDDREERRIGLMVMGDRIIREYPNNYQARQHAERYLECIQMIEKQRAISIWISRNRSYCAWMEPESHTETAHPLQSRSDHSGRRGGGHQNMPAHLQNHDPNAVDESDIDDDDSRSDDEDSIRDVVVRGCGVPEINGVYTRAGAFDGVPKYSQSVRYNGRDEEFSLFRCRLTDNTRRWYISIVPMNSHPGTTRDIDFYAAVPSTNETIDFPPRKNWMCIPNSGGILPAPEVYPRSLYDDVDENHGPKNIVVDQDQTGYL